MNDQIRMALERIFITRSLVKDPFAASEVAVYVADTLGLSDAMPEDSVGVLSLEPSMPFQSDWAVEDYARGSAFAAEWFDSPGLAGYEHLFHGEVTIGDHLFDSDLRWFEGTADGPHTIYLNPTEIPLDQGRRKKDDGINELKNPYDDIIGLSGLMEKYGNSSYKSSHRKKDSSGFGDSGSAYQTSGLHFSELPAGHVFDNMFGSRPAAFDQDFWHSGHAFADVVGTHERTESYLVIVHEGLSGFYSASYKKGEVRAHLVQTREQSGLEANVVKIKAQEVLIRQGIVAPMGFYRVYVGGQEMPQNLLSIGEQNMSAVFFTMDALYGGRPGAIVNFGRTGPEHIEKLMVDR